MALMMAVSLTDNGVVRINEIFLRRPQAVLWNGSASRRTTLHCN